MRLRLRLSLYLNIFWRVSEQTAEIDVERAAFLYVARCMGWRQKHTFDWPNQGALYWRGCMCLRLHVVAHGALQCYCDLLSLIKRVAKFSRAPPALVKLPSSEGGSGAESVPKSNSRWLINANRENNNKVLAAQRSHSPVTRLCILGIARVQTECARNTN